nr:hypothetical protein GCM10010200_063320 [Actinomadura rugatobispora]
MDQETGPRHCRWPLFHAVDGGNLVVFKALVATPLLGTFLVGCSGSTESLPTSSAVPKTPVPSTSVMSRGFERGEIRTTPDPRTLLSPSLRRDLRFADAKASSCKKEKAYDRVEKWVCHLFTPQESSESDMISIRVELPTPENGRTATEKATKEFADLKWSLRNFSPCSIRVQLGDEACQSPKYTSSLKSSAVLFRIRNVNVQIMAATGDKDRASVSALSDEQGRRAWRVASELARGLERRG